MKIKTKVFLSIGLILILGTIICVYSIFINNKEKDNDSLVTISNNTTLVDVNTLKSINQYIDIEKYYVYGTNFNLEGKLSNFLDQDSIIKNCYFELYNASSDSLLEYELIYDVKDDRINFTLSNYINKAINLEELSLENM